MKYSPDFSSRFRILKGGKISLVVSALIASVTMLHAAPSGGVVTSGSANIAQNGSVTTITQSTNKAAINWQNFSIGTSETVNFNQPTVNAVTLNRVVGNEKSIIDGALNANGQVFILNSNGVLFSKNASINTAGLVATTMNLSDADFMNGNYAFRGESTASVINQGTINISDKGYATLFGKEVKNEGIIKATLGKVELAGAKEVTLNLNGNSLVNLTVDKGVLDALVENKGAIYADGGEVYLTTNAVNELLKGVVNNTGIIEANSLEDITGEVILFAHGGALHVNGTIEVEGGFVETSGKTLHVEDSTIIKTKKWLIDPDNITIESSGGDVLTGEGVSATAIQNALSTTDIELQATYDITVNENITWATDKKLTLKAGDEIRVNATIENTNTTNGGVYFNANNTTDKVIFGTNGLVSISNVYQLQWINQALNGKYALGGNINASATASWDSDSGFVPIGDDTNQFSGTFDGQGYVIDALTIKRPMTDFVGLFGRANTGTTIKNVGLTNANIIGQYSVGGLVGFHSQGSITNAYVTGNVSGTSGVGGLVGTNYGSITNAYTTSNVTGGENEVGGLVGYHRQGSITNAYAKGNVNGTSGVGGLVGWIYDGTVTNVYATGNVSGTSGVGGLVGILQYDGNHIYSASITNAYATGNVSGTSVVGGLVGDNTDGIITASFWNTTSSGTTTGVGAGTSTGVTGKTTAQMQDPLLYANAMWDTTVWAYGSGVAGYGIGLAYLKNVTAVADRPTQTTLFSGGFGTSATPYTITNWTQLQNINNSNILTHNYYFTLSNNIDNTTADYTALASATANSGAGWNPIGDANNKFIGNFNGANYTIGNLYINRDTPDRIGLFGHTFNATLANIGVTDADITGRSYVGILAGWVEGGSVSNSHTSGIVKASLQVGGGLVGQNQSTIDLSYSLAQVEGVSSYIGGLVGSNEGSILNSYATGKVLGGASSNRVGGLVGSNARNYTITNSYATGEVTGNTNVGGLVGQNNGYNNGDGTIDQGKIANSYATGKVTGVTNVGGLVGENLGYIKTSYAIGEVSDGTNVGGLVGNNTITGEDAITTGTIDAVSFWDTVTSKKGTSAGGVGKTTTDMKTLATFAGWDIAGTDGGYPTLTLGGEPVWTMSPPPIIGLSYTLDTQNHVYKGSIYTLADFWSASSIFGASYASWVLGTDYTFIYDGSSTTGFKNAGTYSNITIDILKSGYTEASTGNTAGVLTITPKALSITGLSADNKTYDGTTSVVMTNWGSLSGLVGTETLTLGHGTASFDTATVGNGKTVTAIGYTLSDGTNGGVVGNYLLAANTATTTANITAVVTPPVVTPPVVTPPVVTPPVVTPPVVTPPVVTPPVVTPPVVTPPVVTPPVVTPPVVTPPVVTPPTQDISPIITQIINGTAITPPVIPTFTPPTPPAQAPQQFNVGGTRVQLASVPSGDSPSQLVGTQEARAMIQGEEVGDLRIPLGQNSRIQLVNGGVRLPDGLEQQFFMAQR